MRTFTQTPGVFVVEEDARVLRLCLLGLLCLFVLGIITGWSQLEWFVGVPLSGFAVLFAFFLAQAPLTAYARFERAAGRVEITRRSLYGGEVDSYPLSHFKRVRIEEQSDEGTTYRLVFVFSEALPDALDPAARERLQKHKRRGANLLPLNEIPLQV